MSDYPSDDEPLQHARDWLREQSSEGAAAIGPAVETKFESWGRERDQREDDQ